MPRQISANVRATGPGPLRTARGAGRAAVRRVRDVPRDDPRVDDPRVDFVEVGFFFGAGLRFALVLRDRVLDPLRDVVVLRDPGGEDVRVAMVSTLGARPTRHTHHTRACLVVGRPPRIGVHPPSRSLRVRADRHPARGRLSGRHRVAHPGSVCTRPLARSACAPIGTPLAVGSRAAIGSPTPDRCAPALSLAPRARRSAPRSRSALGPPSGRPPRIGVHPPSRALRVRADRRPVRGRLSGRHFTRSGGKRSSPAAESSGDLAVAMDQVRHLSLGFPAWPRPPAGPRIHSEES